MEILWGFVPTFFAEESQIINTLCWKPYQPLTHLFHISLIFTGFDVLSMFHQFLFSSDGFELEVDTKN
jgi:hypothetical protein